MEKLNPKSSALMVLNDIWQCRGFPVDPVWIAKQLGIDVIETKLPDNVSGALIKEIDQDPVIILSQIDSKNRKRFSCAHELGHYAHRISNGADQYEYVDLRGQSARNGTDPDEIFANRFAAELLMPSDEVSILHKKGNPAFLIASHFGVSDDAIRYRLKNLRLIK